MVCISSCVLHPTLKGVYDRIYHIGSNSSWPSRCLDSPNFYVNFWTFLICYLFFFILAVLVPTPPTLTQQTPFPVQINTAIQFVLNDKFSNLRAEDRQRLIHEGSGKDIHNASVEIVFDNKDQRFPVCPFFQIFPSTLSISTPTLVAISCLWC